MSLSDTSYFHCIQIPLLSSEDANFDPNHSQIPDPGISKWNHLIGREYFGVIAEDSVI